MIPSEAAPSEWLSSKDRNCKKEQNRELSQHKKKIDYVKQLLRQIRTPANRTKLLLLPLLSYIFQKGALHYSVFAKKWKRVVSESEQSVADMSNCIKKKKKKRESSHSILALDCPKKNQSFLASSHLLL